MSERDTTVLIDGQLAVATAAQSGELITGPSPIETTALVQTDDGPQLCVKTFNVGGGGGGGDASWGSITGTLSNQTDLQNALNSKQGATSIVTLTTASTELASNTIYNGGELASVTLTLPATIPADFIAQVEFTSGTTPTLFTAPAALYFNGDRCEAGTFTPIASHRYCIMIISDGANTLGFCYER